MNDIRLHDKVFEPYISQDEILRTVRELSRRVAEDVQGMPVFIVTLKGAAPFAMDFAKFYQGDAVFDYIRVKSYAGTGSTGKVDIILDVTENIEGKNVYILEDIVDTGTTLEIVLDMVKKKNPASVKVVTLFHKPEAYQKNIPLDFIGMNIPNKFIVGYGLDYNELGRNLQDIYQLKS